MDGVWGTIDRALLEAEPLLREGALFRHLLWPMARPALIASGTIVFALAINQFSVPALLQVKVLPAEIWVQFSTNLETASAWRAGWPLLLLSVGALAVAWVSWPKTTWVVPRDAATASLLRERLAPWVPYLLIAGSCILFLALVLPLAELVGAGRTWQQLPGAWQAGRGALGHSLLYAGGAAIFAVLIPRSFGDRARIRPARRRWPRPPYGFRFFGPASFSASRLSWLSIARVFSGFIGAPPSWFSPWSSASSPSVGQA